MNPKDLLLGLYKFIKDFLSDLTSLQDDTDVDGTIRIITKGVDLKGANIWILIASAMLASIGLDVNSSAVIIGAMLISPLMSPILGIGLGTGIADQDLLWKSLKSFSVAVVVSLVASTFYFLLTPLGQVTPELLARTKPTLLDVGVAIFGGIAGIVANSRMEKSNAIPGVAIATALMPPLCTAGFGIAKGDYSFFLGAFYLFFINSVFISLSTYVIVRFLQFPYKQFLDIRVKKRIQKWIVIFVVIVVVPSGIIFWDVVKDANAKHRIELFLDNVISSEKYEAINWEMIETDSLPIVKVFVIGEPIPSNSLTAYDSLFKLEFSYKMNLKFVQMNVPESERDKIKNEVASEVAMSVLRQVAATKDVISENEMKIDSLKSIIDKINLTTDIMQQIRGESQIVFPDISNISFGLLKSENYDSLTLNSEMIPISILEYNENVRTKEKIELNNKYRDYMKLRLNRDTVFVISN